jgi:osmotically-inducible protein OsmY
MKARLPSLAATTLAVVLAGSVLAGCAPLIIGAAASTALMATDRRSSGAQIDDEAIELRAAARLRESLGDRANISVTSYNRQVLLTGEVPSEAARQQAELVVSRVDNVRGLVNELGVMPPTSLTQRSGDVLITGKIRASLVDAQDLQANAFKVVTERGTVFLMGRVTQREADRATLISRQISGVGKVVRIFEIVTPEDLARAGAPAPVRPATATVAPTAPLPAEQQPAAGGVVTTPVR